MINSIACITALIHIHIHINQPSKKGSSCVPEALKLCNMRRCVETNCTLIISYTQSYAKKSSIERVFWGPCGRSLTTQLLNKITSKKKNKTRCDTKRARSIKRCTVLHRACSVCVGDKQTVTYRKNMYYANANEVKRCNRTKCTQLHNPNFDGTESCTTPSLLRRQLQGS